MESSSWFTLLFSRLRDYQFYPVTLAVLHKAYFVWGQEHPKLAPVESSEGRENQRKLGYRQVYPRSYWELQAWKRNIPRGRGTGLLDQCLGIGETLRLFRTKKILKYIPGLLKTTHLIFIRTKDTSPYFKVIYSHFLRAPGVQTNFVQHTKSVSHAGITLFIISTDLHEIMCPVLARLDYQKRPSSDLIWRGTKTSRDLVALLATSRPRSSLRSLKTW